MAHLTHYDYPGLGERVRPEQHMSQAVRIGGVIEIAGQGGWRPLDGTYPDTLAKHVDQTFANVEHCLQQGGGKGWSEVYKVRCYYLDIACAGDLIRNLRKYCPDYAPVFTAVQVAGLAFPEMRIEIEVCAHVKKP